MTEAPIPHRPFDPHPDAPRPFPQFDHPDDLIPPDRSPNHLNVFRGQEYPLHFDFTSQYYDESFPLTDGTIVGIALSYVRGMSQHNLDQLIEDDHILVWLNGTVIEMSPSRYKAKELHKPKTNGKSNNGHHP